MTVLLILAILPAAAQVQKGHSSSRELKDKPRSELLACLTARNYCDAEGLWQLADLLGTPENKSFLLHAFSRTSNLNRRLGIIYSLYKIHDDVEVASFFRRLMKQHFDDGENLYYPLNYLAKRCDKQALDILSGNGKGNYAGYPGCLQWAKTVELFGRCDYRPAIPYLIDSINAACMNIGIAAVGDLQKMFPDSPKDFSNYSIPEIQEYFRKRAKAETQSHRKS